MTNCVSLLNEKGSRPLFHLVRGTSGFAPLHGDKAEPQLTSRQQAGVKNSWGDFTSHMDVRPCRFPIPVPPGPPSCCPWTCPASPRETGHSPPPETPSATNVSPLAEKCPLGQLLQAAKRVIQLTSPLVPPQLSVCICHCKNPYIYISISINSVKTNPSYESVAGSAVLRISLASERASDSIYLSSLCFSRHTGARRKGLSNPGNKRTRKSICECSQQNKPAVLPY